jgi:hypothetical protein
LIPDQGPDWVQKIEAIMDKLAHQCNWYWFKPGCESTIYCILDIDHTGDHQAGVNAEDLENMGLTEVDPKYWHAPKKRKFNT